VGVAQDVTVAAKNDRAVAAMARELRQLVDTANAPIFGIDVDGNVNEWNDKTAEITGFSKEEAMDSPLVSTFIVPDLRQSVQDVMAKALKGTETSNYELEFRTKTNEIRHLLVNATTRRDAESKIVGVVGVAQDVTDDRKHSEELRDLQYIRASQEAKVETERNMTAYFAHELRNPLHAVDSALSLMPDDLPQEARMLVQAMNDCTSFMSSIMNNLLDVRKMEEGKMILNRVPLSLSALLKSVYNMLRASVRPGVKMMIICETGDKDWVLGDSHRMQQVLTNVITNAIKYTAAGSIVLSMKWRGDILRFECTDTGPGIPKEDQSSLFMRFVQRGGAPGSGLGLAIAKHLVDLAGGRTGFESDPTIAPGTTCFVELPLENCVQPEIVKKAAPEAMIDEQITFLLIDDVRMNRTMFRRRINKGIAPNAVITEASTGEEALEICKNKTFDFIIVDQHMEEAGGLLLGTETVVTMRQRKIASFIIGCSGNDIEDEFMAAGSDWAIAKPTPPNNVILKQLRCFLTKRRQTDNLIGEQIISLAKEVAGKFEHALQAGTPSMLALIDDEARIQLDCPQGKIHPTE
jgi:PAS domain S-box-containing protein